MRCSCRVCSHAADLHYAFETGAERGLTPFTIGSIMCRETVNQESVIEQIVREAQDSLLPGMSESAFMASVSQVMDSWLDKLTN
ncbi:hypothetical protein F3Y22_tig00110348pilonHSYRG00068 [Hibiscus syriacus]|uniref:Uncharacterized protein n=1 Tax=Hibiscus syriacus TaxID=106335 RepID=A0A6A3AU29_HIBSY|nr:hypothetical protein F3Y22_tig00110348pilonHSYRG00068 [Hibiscus syriacus]